jgi:hypothetical protein
MPAPPGVGENFVRSYSKSLSPEEQSKIVGIPRFARDKGKALLGSRSNYPITKLLNYQFQSLFHFYQLSTFCLEIGDDLLLLDCGNKIIMRHFHVEAAAALRHGRKFRSIGQHL